MRYVLGLCTGKDEIFAAIRSSERIREIEGIAKAGRLRVGTMSRLMAPHLAEDVDSYLGLSIMQAMAGPASKEDSRYFRGRPVAELAERIFKDHLARLSARRGGGAMGRVLWSLESDGELPGSEAVEDPTAWMPREAAIEYLVELMKDPKKRQWFAKRLVDRRVS